MFCLAVAFALFAITLRIRNDRRAAFWGRLEAEWEPAILEALSGAAPPAAILRCVRPEHTLYFVDFAYRYARRIRGWELETLRQITLPFLKPIAVHAKSGDVEQRARAVATLGALAFEDYVAEISAALDDPSPLVARIAVQALVRSGKPEHAAVILARLHRFENLSPQFLASMLASVGLGIAAALREVLTDRSKPIRTRSTAAETLRMLNDLSSADPAAAIAPSESDRDLLAAVLRLLGCVGRSEHLLAIRYHASSSDPVVRAQAVAALGRLGSGEDLDLLQQRFEDSSSWVAVHAAWGLKRLGGREQLQAWAESGHPRSALARQALTEDGP